MSELLQNIHDKTLKSVLSDTNLAKRFFTQHLPNDIQTQVKLDSLRLQKGSFVDAKLSEHLTDLLYSVELGQGEGYIYLLLEHQSSPDRLMAFRLLKYMVNIMEHHLKKHKTKTLPLVFPMVYYTGARKATQFVPDMMDLFEQPELAKAHFLKPFTLIDLQRLSDDELLKDKALAGIYRSPLKLQILAVD